MRLFSSFVQALDCSDWEKNFDDCKQWNRNREIIYQWVVVKMFMMMRMMPIMMIVNHGMDEDELE